MNCFNCSKEMQSAEALMWDIFPCCLDCFKKMMKELNDKPKPRNTMKLKSREDNPIWRLDKPCLKCNSRATMLLNKEFYCDVCRSNKNYVK